MTYGDMSIVVLFRDCRSQSRPERMSVPWTTRRPFLEMSSWDFVSLPLLSFQFDRRLTVLTGAQSLLRWEIGNK